MSVDGVPLIDIRNELHPTPLILSAVLAFPDYVRLLLAKNVNINEMVEHDMVGEKSVSGDALMFLIISLRAHPVDHTPLQRGSLNFPPIENLKRFGIQKVINKIGAATRNIIHENLKTCSFQTLLDEKLHYDQKKEVFDAYVSAYGAEAMKCVSHR